MIVHKPDCICVECEDAQRDRDRQKALALGRIAYESFAEQRIALGAGMPPWRAMPGQQELPATEREIWAKVAEAVAAAIPFVITDEVCEAMRQAPVPHGWKGHEMRRSELRAAALAAGFRTEER